MGKYSTMEKVCHLNEKTILLLESQPLFDSISLSLDSEGRVPSHTSKGISVDIAETSKSLTY